MSHATAETQFGMDGPVAVQCYGTASVTLTAEYGHRGTPRYAEAAHLAAYPKYSQGAHVQPGAHHTEHPRKFLPAPQRHAGRRSHVDAEASHLLPRQHTGEVVVPEEKPTPEDPFAEPRVPLSEWRWDDNLAAAEECATRTNAPVKAFPGITHRLSVVISLCKEDLSSLADLPCRVPPPLRLVLEQEVVARQTQGGAPTLPPGSPRIGVALVFCEEPISFIDEVGCNGVVYHLYSKCGVTRARAEAMAPKSAACFASFSEVPVTLETELAWPKHHAQYLQHIITRYDRLEPYTIFVKANLEKRRLSLGEMVNIIDDNHWGFISFGNPKIKVNMTSFPETGHVGVWQREICALYWRYTGADPCQMDEAYMKEIGFKPYFYNTRSMSLPVTEYQWFREYIMSITFEKRVKRRYVPERIWQAMLGCPSELKTRDIIGCSPTEWHPSGLAVEPPGVMLADGLVTWPQIPVQEFDPDLPYPSFFRKHNTPRVTFVGSYVGGYDEDARTVMVSVLVAAAKLHPDCTFVMLTDMTTPREMFSPDMWLGRLEVRRYDLDYQQRAQDLQYTPKMSSAADFFQAHGVEAGSAPDWQGDVKLQKLIAAFTWARLHLEACFLRDAMVAVQTGYFGHLALMDFSAFFTNSIADIFEPPGSSGVGGWQAGIVYRPVKGAVAATSVWYVPQNHAAEAFALVTVALQMARPVDTGPAFKGEGYLDVHSQAMTAALHCCLSSTDDEQWWRSGGQQSALCDLGACGLKRGNAPPSITLNLLPCANNLAHVGGSFVRQCAMPNSPADALATKAVKWGQRESLSEVYGLFKVKDKSTGYLSTKSAIRDFITVYGDAEPALAQRYTDLVQALVDP
eukprot:jgi/Tetstr1/444072/TSEL_003312.t1